MAGQTSKLGRDVYIALAAIGWSDGQLDEEEADAIVRTALEEGLELEEIEEIEEATKQPIDMGVIDMGATDIGVASSSPRGAFTETGTTLSFFSTCTT